MFRVDKINYFDKFHCIMGECPDNCCEMDWNILVDDISYAKYQACKEEDVRNFISQEIPHKILKKNHKCPFFQADGLCMLHKEYGEGFLCETCRNYPRLTSCYEDLYVVSLAPSCPAVLELLWLQERTEIKTEVFYECQEDLKEEKFEMSESLAAKLRFREELLEIARDRQFSLAERVKQMAAVLGMAGFSEDLPQAVEWARDYIRENCLINRGIRRQSELIAGTVFDERMALNIVCGNLGFQRFFEHILVYSIIEQVFRMEKMGDRDKHRWLEKIVLRLAVMQYWLALLYGVQGKVSRDDCNTAVYSLMRILDHDEEAWEKCYGRWKREVGGLPLVLW